MDGPTLTRLWIIGLPGTSRWGQLALLDPPPSIHPYCIVDRSLLTDQGAE